MIFLEEEFKDLNPAVAAALREQLQHVIRKVVTHQRAKLADPANKSLTQEDISAIIYSIIDLASRLKHPGKR